MQVDFNLKQANRQIKYIPDLATILCYLQRPIIGRYFHPESLGEWGHSAYTLFVWFYTTVMSHERRGVSDHRAWLLAQQLVQQRKHKVRRTGPLNGKSTHVTDGYLAQRANNAEIASLWWSNAQRTDVSNSVSECEAVDVFSYIKMISILY